MSYPLLRPPYQILALREEHVYVRAFDCFENAFVETTMTHNAFQSLCLAQLVNTSERTVGASFDVWRKI